MPVRSQQERLLTALLQSAIGREVETNPNDLPGTPDIVFRDQRLAVLFHGCFWHSHDCPAGAQRPRANWRQWYESLERTVIRDTTTLQEYRNRGWRALVVWECDFLQDPNAQVHQILAMRERDALLTCP